MHLNPISDCCFELPIGFVPGMKVPGKIFVNEKLHDLLLEEHAVSSSSPTGFLSALTQIANVATLPGITGHSVALPDVHSGYGFAIGNVAAFDCSLPQEAIVSPGGVGFDINCGVRLLRTNLLKTDVLPLQHELASKIFEMIPVGIGGSSTCNSSPSDMTGILERGMAWALENDICWEADLEFTEDRGTLPVATWRDVSERALKRGINQLGTLGAGNHYVEVQWVDEIYDWDAARRMGIHSLGQICVMIHCGSRGLGHQVASDYIEQMEKPPQSNQLPLIDRQLTCAPIGSPLGQQYISAMGAAANFAFVNRSQITLLLREAFSQVFGAAAEDLDMNVVYDVAHNVAKQETHLIDGQWKQLLVHRKGSTRAFGPGSPGLPSSYASIGQPVLVGGSMGTCSYVLCGTEGAMRDSLGSTCHGAGRALSRHSARKALTSQQVLDSLSEQGIVLRAANAALISEEAPSSYKDVNEVVDSCERAGISKKIFKLKPFCVIKG